MSDEATVEDIFTDAWEPHSHPEFGPEGGVHVHAPDADWSVSMGFQMMLRHEVEVDVIELMEFKGLLMGMRAGVEEGRASTDLAEATPAMRQFTVIAYNAERMLLDSLSDLTDQALVGFGINPPCQLQPVKSSNIRSFGFVLQQGEDQLVAPTAGTLYVAFDKTLYRYESVPVNTVKAWTEAESKGQFFAAYIRKNFEFTKVV